MGCDIGNDRDAYGDIHDIERGGMVMSKLAQWLPYVIIRWYIKKMVPERGTLVVHNGPTNKGKFWEIFPNEVIFIGDREAYMKRIAKLEKVKKRLEHELEQLDEVE